MTQFGYTALCEQTPVNQLVTDLVAAEQAEFIRWAHDELLPALREL